MTPTECARCGDCCDPVTVGFHVETYAPRRLAEPDLDPESRANCEFMLAHWTTTATLVRDEGLGAGEVAVAYEVRCDAFNTATRECGAHADRPPVCRDFPWYGRAVDDVEGRAVVAAGLSPRCSFNRDVPGRALLPLTVVTR